MGKKYIIVFAFTHLELTNLINEYAKFNYKLVNCWAVENGRFEKHYAAMEKISD